jgi:RimJ/RimL family protein N-acetyltransferase
MTLQNEFVRLEPLAPAHLEGLVEAALDRSTFSFALVPRDQAEMRAYVADALAEQSARRSVPFAVVSSDRVVGSIRFMNMEWWRWPAGPVQVDGDPRGPDDPPDVVEIGHGWLRPEVQRTAVFKSCAFLMMRQAFEVWRVHRVTLKTDARNQRSRAAILRVGGQFEGVLRAHLPAADGVVRDTAMFSVVRAEWPAVRSRLESYLGTPHTG